jgi:hypothetical protein
MAGWWFSLSTPVSSTNNKDRQIQLRQEIPDK